MDDVSRLWAADVTVEQMTDTDLVSNRADSQNVSNRNRDLLRAAETLRRKEGHEDTSFTLDWATRIEHARAIDAGDVPFTRQDWDVRYTIPPEGWVLSVYGVDAFAHDSSKKNRFGKRLRNAKPQRSSVPSERSNDDILGGTDGYDVQRVELVPAGEVDADAPTVHFSTATVILEMSKAAVAEGAYPTVSDLVYTAVLRLLGHDVSDL
jgi:hypothetical protein